MYRGTYNAATMDHIFIRDLRIETLIGFHKRERIVPQTLRLDLEIGIANTAVFESDKVTDCIDYETVTIRIRELWRASTSTSWRRWPSAPASLPARRPRGPAPGS